MRLISVVFGQFMYEERIAYCITRCNYNMERILFSVMKLNTANEEKNLKPNRTIKMIILVLIYLIKFRLKICWIWNVWLLFDCHIFFSFFATSNPNVLRYWKRNFQKENYQQQKKKKLSVLNSKKRIKCLTKLICFIKYRIKLFQSNLLQINCKCSNKEKAISRILANVSLNFTSNFIH